MSYRVFTLPMHNSGAAETELNGILASHRVLSVDRRFVLAGKCSFWSFCVDFVRGLTEELINEIAPRLLRSVSFSVLPASVGSAFRLGYLTSDRISGDGFRPSRTYP